MTKSTVLVLGDQLDVAHPCLASADPRNVRVLMLESEALIRGRRYHVQRLHLVLTAMRRYAEALRARGFEVDYRRVPSFAEGLSSHRRMLGQVPIQAAEPMSRSLRQRLIDADVQLVPHARFVCSYQEFAAWASTQRHLRMDEFYRQQRRRTGYLMQGDKPEGGAFSFDKLNREPAPRGPVSWPAPVREPLDALDHEVLASLPATAFGAPPDGTWATSREGAVARLEHFIEHVLPRFGPHQDVMLRGSWHLAHAMLSAYLNIGLLHPREVCEAAIAAYHGGRAPLASVEGFVRQVLGWREYVWGTYWLFGPQYAQSNALEAKRPLLPLYTEPERTRMRCVEHALLSVHDHAYAHHIQRLMILGNLSLLAGVQPRALSDWMQASFIDGGEWVMWPNVIGMALYADGGRMSTKPYAAGGAYVKRMSDLCQRCVYEPTARVGPRACPFTALYWDFVARHQDRLAHNPRTNAVVRGLARLRDLPEVRERAAQLLEGLSRGEV